jgi:hypothetical protein
MQPSSSENPKSALLYRDDCLDYPPVSGLNQVSGQSNPRQPIIQPVIAFINIIDPKIVKMLPKIYQAILSI